MTSATPLARLGPLSRLRSVFLGPGSLTDFGQRYLILDRDYQTSTKGMYAIGDLAGTPDIKAALNAGYHIGRDLASKPRRTQAKVDYDVVVVGAGPAGIGAASELAKVGKRVLVLERKKVFQTVRAFAKSKALWLASTGERALHGDFPFEDCEAEACIASWDTILAKKDIEVRSFEAVTEIRQRGAFEVHSESKEGGARTCLADRVVIAIGKPKLLDKLAFEGATEERVHYQLRSPVGMHDEQVLVVAHAGCYEGFEMALELCPDNEVTLIYEEPGADDVSASLRGRLTRAAKSGQLRYLPNTKLNAIEPSEVELELPSGARERVVNGHIFSGKVIDRELPTSDLARFGLKAERRMSLGKWLLAMALFAFFAFVYMGKSGKLEAIWPAFKGVREGIEATFGGLYMYQLWTTIYCLGIVGFGARAILKYRRDYRDAEQGSHQTRRLLTLMASQVFFLAILPEVFLGNWRAYGIVLAWPLNLNPASYEAFIAVDRGDLFQMPSWVPLAGELWFSPNHFYFGWTLLLSFVLVPLLVWRGGMRYCTWICSCGGLAETVGDDWRQFSPKGPANTRRERSIYWVLGFTSLVMLTAIARAHAPLPEAARQLADGAITTWAWVVDLFMCGILPLVLYPYLGGRSWCRYACPTAGFMKLISRKATVTGIQPDRSRCIACGSCDRFCEVGVPIRKHALKGQFFSANDTTCISCGICISVCPTDVLRFDLAPDKRPLPMSV
jgi:NosR/NirI family transcriptional regulator, nitrous oxide reductase regulator